MIRVALAVVLFVCLVVNLTLALFHVGDQLDTLESLGWALVASTGLIYLELEDKR